MARNKTKPPNPNPHGHGCKYVKAHNVPAHYSSRKGMKCDEVNVKVRKLRGPKKTRHEKNQDAVNRYHARKQKAADKKRMNDLD
jgi:hypothetical protein